MVIKVCVWDAKLPWWVSDGSRNWNRILCMLLYLQLNVFHSYKLLFFSLLSPIFYTPFFCLKTCSFAWMQLFSAKHSIIMRNILKQKKVEMLILCELQFCFQRSFIHLQIHSNHPANFPYFHTHTKSDYYPELNKITSLWFFVCFNDTPPPQYPSFSFYYFWCLSPVQPHHKQELSAF